MNRFRAHVVWLQRTVGITIAVGSGLSAAIAFFDLKVGLNYVLIETFAHPSVWLSVLFVPAAALTAKYIGSVGQWAQIAFCFVAAIAAVLTSTSPNDLTSFVFVGLGYFLANRYRKIERNVGRVFVPVTAVYLGAWLATNMNIIGGPAVQLLFSALGGGTLLMLTFAIVHSTSMEQREVQAYLEEAVRERTSEVREALTRQENLTLRNEVLLKELHHRTKNNLQVMISLLSIQRSRTDDSARKATAVLEQAEQRIQSLATTHEVFYQTDQVVTVELAEYVQAIVGSFSHSQGAIELHLDMEKMEEMEEMEGGGIPMTMDNAVLVGLVINEILTNVVEHAYPGSMLKPVWITLGERDGLVELRIADRGVGMDRGVGTATGGTATAGLEIIDALVAQLRGRASVVGTPHTVWSIAFPIPAY
ncbi:MAG: sensor histidine kinase [Alkalispirochaeta sp.]|jgi:two-component sensor histidine kinase